MSKKGDVQVSVRMPKTLNEQCSIRAELAGQTLAEWIRRAMQEKLDSELNGTDDSYEAFKAKVLRVLKELKIDPKIK